MDNRRFRRLLYEVLDHNPTQEDILRFFRRFHEALTTRGRTLRGVTTDGSPLYPEAITNVFGPVKHQVCEFHVLAELTKAVLKAVAQVRRQLKGTRPKFGRGRPSQADRKRAARKRRIEQKIAGLFEHRHLFVQHHLTAAQQKTLRRITRGLPALRTLRRIMDEVYRLFDRRCRTDTALAKLARLRRRVARFQGLRQTLGKLFSPNLEKALTFLDDSLLPATSNAVERGNRRHRKMQKTVYRVRTAPHISRRIAADMLRDTQAEGRLQTTHTLHLARAGQHVPGNGATVSIKARKGNNNRKRFTKPFALLLFAPGSAFCVICVHLRHPSASLRAASAEVRCFLWKSVAGFFLRRGGGGL